MNHILPRFALAQYRCVDAYGSVESADPHKLVELLYDGLAEALTITRGAVERGNIAEKVMAVRKAAGIIDALRASLDLERGGEVAANLERLYDYMGRLLTRANLHGDVHALREMLSINETLRNAWAAIPEDERAGSMAA